MQVFTCIFPGMPQPISEPPSIQAVFRAIAHAGRRHLLARLADVGGLTLGQLAGLLPMTRQAVSQHLAILEEADLVVTRRHGREKLHYLNPTPLVDAYEAWLAPLITPQARALVALRDSLESGQRDAADAGEPGRQRSGEGHG